MPPLLVLTDRTQVPAGRSLVDQVQGCIDGGARAVVLREKDLPRGERRALAEPIKVALDAVDGLLNVASDRYLASDVAAAGCHVGADAAKYWRGKDPASTPPPGATERRRLRTAWKSARRGFTWGQSCHRDDDLSDVTDSVPNYISISPIFASTSKPGYGPAIGTDGLADYLRAWHDRVWGAFPEEATPLVYALGGIETPELAARCIAAGADGVAVMGALMRADDPVAATAAFLASLAATTLAPQDTTT